MSDGPTGIPITTASTVPRRRADAVRDGRDLLLAAPTAALTAGVGVQRRVLASALESPALAKMLSAVARSRPLQGAIERALDSDASKQIVAIVIASSTFDEILSRLEQSDGLSRFIETVVDSPAVSAAITQQGLGFADPVGAEIRTRSRSADDWVEGAVARSVRRKRSRSASADSDPTGETP
jgi:hypothetical protein